MGQGGSGWGGHPGLCWTVTHLLLSPCPPLTPCVCVPPPAMQQVLDNLMGLPGTPGAADLDLIFLRGIMESPIVRSLAKVP